MGFMRVTVDLDEDVVAAVDRLRKQGSLGIGEAVNQLVRAGLRASEGSKVPFRQRTQPIGLKIDVTNVAEALEIIDFPSVETPRSGSA